VPCARCAMCSLHPWTNTIVFALKNLFSARPHPHAHAHTPMPTHAPTRTHLRPLALARAYLPSGAACCCSDGLTWVGSRRRPTGGCRELSWSGTLMCSGVSSVRARLCSCLRECGTPPTPAPTHRRIRQLTTCVPATAARMGSSA
jgi:hypothetical protein